MALGRGADHGYAHQRSDGEIERLQQFSREIIDIRFVTLVTFDCKARLRGRSQKQLAVDHHEAGAQALVADDDFPETLLETLDVERSVDPERLRKVVRQLSARALGQRVLAALCRRRRGEL